LTPSLLSSATPGPGAPGTETGARRERLMAALLLLPPALFCLPFAGAPLARDPYPHLAGAGWLALAALPAAAVAWRRVRASAGLALLAAVVVAGALSAVLGDATDTVELRRAGVHAAAVLALFAAGSALGPAGRAWLARGLIVVALASLAGAFALRDLRLAGTLGNTGALSQAALPGAVAGLLLAASGATRPAWRVAGALAFAGFAVHAGRAPVLAGILAAGGALVLAAALARASSGRARLALVGGALLLPLAFLAPRLGPGAGDASDGVAADTGGAGVRLGVWKRIPAFLGDHLAFGVGPGQMQAAFPPYRDPAEIAASAHGSCADHPTEIDHLHNDALHELGELGLVGGLLWLAFLALGAWRALAALGDRGPSRAALGAGAIALGANALAHSALVFHPASAALGFALFGALSARDARADDVATPDRTPSLLASLALLPVLAAAFLGRPLIAHGSALAAAKQGRDEAILASEAGQPGRAWDAAQRWKRYEGALIALPDSVEALRLAAEWKRVEAELGQALHETAPEDPRPALAHILALRPYDAFAHQELALVSLKLDGDVAAARRHWEAVLAVDPGHPRVLRNLVNLELDHGAVQRASERLDALRAAGCEDPAWVAGVAARLLLDGRGEPALALLARDDARFDVRTGEAVMALSNALEAEGLAELAYGLESHAHHLWAEEHAEHASYANAVRSLRQAIRPTASRHAGGAALLRLELCAAQLKAGDADGAAKTAEGLSLAMPAARFLPAWARAALVDGGL
jgi:O-antigen ligase